MRLMGVHRSRNRKSIHGVPDAGRWKARSDSQSEMRALTNTR